MAKFVNGMSMEPWVIRINGEKHEYKNDWISFETLAAKAGMQKTAKVVAYEGKKTTGELRPGNVKVLEENMRFEVKE